MKNHATLQDKVVLITGAAGGIGAATARALYRNGARLVLTDLDAQALATLAREFAADRVLARTLDVTDIAATRAVVARTVAIFGRLDIVFANAGIAWDPPTTIAACDEADFERVVDVDFLGVWRTIKATLPEIINNHGQVLITASIYAFANGVVNTPYAASKAAVEMLGRALRVELASTGASASVLYPGWVDTPLVEVAFGGNKTVTELVERVFPGPLGRRISPQQVATAVVNGLARRAPRIIVPRRWLVPWLFSGLVNMVTDWFLVKDSAVQRSIRDLDDR